MTMYKTHKTGVREVFDHAQYDRSFPDAAITTCGHCGRSWDDHHITGWTPVPSGRCPFEYEHEDEDVDNNGDDVVTRFRA